MKKMVVLNSGGFDSVVLLNYLYHIQDEKDLHSIHFLYGARNESQQLRCVNKVCEKLGITSEVVKLPEMSWTKSNFFKDSEYVAENQYLEYRNLIFLSYAISYAESIGAEVVNLALLGDGDYPDTKIEFLEGLNSFLVPSSNITIDAPFIFDSKERLGHIAKYLGIKSDDFFSCDKPTEEGKPCGVCNDCKNIAHLKDKIGF